MKPENFEVRYPHRQTSMKATIPDTPGILQIESIAYKTELRNHVTDLFLLTTRNLTTWEFMCLNCIQAKLIKNYNFCNY